MAKKLLRVLLIVTALIAGWLLRGCGEHRRSGFLTSHTGPTIEQVRALAHLVTAKVEVADAIECRLGGYTGGIVACAIVKGDFLLGTDLSQAKFEQVDAARRTAVLLLPQPQVTQPRVDHTRTRLVALTEHGLWAITPDDGNTRIKLLNRAYADAQGFVARACTDPDLLARARAQAEAALRSFFAAMKWEVEIRWKL